MNGIPNLIRKKLINIYIFFILMFIYINKMSLADILAQHSRDLNANLAHTQEMTQDNVNRKAESLQEKVEHARDAIEAAGGEIAGAGAAWHAGRKIYAKYQKARQALAAKRGAEQPETNSESSGSSEQSARATDPEPEEGGRGGDAQPTEGEATTTSVEKPTSADPEAPEMSGGTAPEEQTPLAEEQSEITDVQQQIPKAQPLGEEQDLGYTPKPDEPSGDLARNIASDDAPPTTKSKVSDINEAVDKEEPSAEGPTLEDAPESALSKIAGDTTQVAGEGGDSLLGDVAGGVVKKVASKAAGIGGDALAEGLSTAGEVLDFLGPVGEAAGVITSLIGLLSGIGKKKEEDQETGEATVGTQAVQTAIDPKALEAGQSVGAQV